MPLLRLRLPPSLLPAGRPSRWARRSAAQPPQALPRAAADPAAAAAHRRTPPQPAAPTAPLRRWAAPAGAPGPAGGPGGRPPAPGPTHRWLPPACGRPVGRPPERWWGGHSCAAGWWEGGACSSRVGGRQVCRPNSFERSPVAARSQLQVPPTCGGLRRCGGGPPNAGGEPVEPGAAAQLLALPHLQARHMPDPRAAPQAVRAVQDGGVQVRRAASRQAGTGGPQCQGLDINDGAWGDGG